MRIITIGAITLLVVSCTYSEAPTEPGVAAQALFGGEASDQGAVVAVVSAGILCSGIVIGPRHVLTARICVTEDGRPDSRLVDPGDRSIVEDPTIGGAPIAVAELIEVDRLLMASTAVLRTVTDLSAAPLTIADTAPAVDDVVTLVGYGRKDTGTGTEGVRRAGETTVTALNPDRITFATEGATNTCSGDAGGAVIDASGRAVGIMYAATGVGCPPTASFHRQLADLRGMLMTIVMLGADAGTAHGDGGGPAGDGGAQPSDGGAPLDDGGTIATDAGPPAEVDGGSMPVASGGGCGCTTTRSAHRLSLLVMLASLALFTRLRRRRW